MKRVVGFLLALVCAIANISFAQFVWTKDAANPVLSGSGNGTWDKHVFGPVVVYNSDSARYEMWYTGSYGPPAWRPYSIGFAYSTDGINWTKHAANPVLTSGAGAWDAGSVEFPAVIRENGQYKMWYSGFLNNQLQIGYATSPDGVRWTKHASNPVLRPTASSWDSGGVAYGQVLRFGGEFKMWYTGSNAGLSIGKIGLATSIDGISWRKDTINNPVLTPGLAGQWDDYRIISTSILMSNNIHYLFYLGVRSSATTAMTGLATSTNGGITWTRHAANPILRPGPTGSWDASYVEGGTVLLRGDNFFEMWYDGSREPTGTYLWRIGHATSPRVGTVRRVPAQYATIQSAINASVHGDTVLVSDGTYYENIRFNGKKIAVASTFLTTGDTSHISRTIINGSFGLNPDSGSVVYFTDGEDTNSVLCGFTITGGAGTVDTVSFPGYPQRAGGGIYATYPARIYRNRITGNLINTTHIAVGAGIRYLGNVTNQTPVIIEQNLVYGNQAYSSQRTVGGVGVTIGLGKARIISNVVSENTGQTDAMLWNVLSGGIEAEIADLIVADNVIERNSVHAPNGTRYPCWGGGFHGYEVTLNLRNNRIAGNVVRARSGMSAYGGGISLYCELSQPTATIANNYVAFNQAIGSSLGGGGGISVRDQQAHIENNIIVKNTGYYAGGIGLSQVNLTGQQVVEDVAPAMFGRVSANSRQNANTLVAPPILMNNTIAYNRATAGLGGGIATRGNWAPKVINTIVYGDTASSEIYVQSGGIRVLYSNVANGWPSDSGNIDVNPQFRDSTYHLTNGSGCLRRGVDSLQVDGIWYRAPSRCFWGTLRPSPSGTRPDIGACELDDPTGIKPPIASGLPTEFRLEQNYPNPFNPTTEIRYQIPEVSRVTLKVFDILGREVAMLVNEVQDAGYKSVQWNASGFASGVYLYRLQAGSFVSTRKMVVVK